MTDAQTVVAAIAGVAGTIAGAIAGSIRRSTRQSTTALTTTLTTTLIENARSGAMLAARIDALDRREELAVHIGRLEAVVTHVQAISVRLERAVETLERDARLDDSQRAKLAKIRTDIARALPTATPMRAKAPVRSPSVEPGEGNGEGNG